MPRLLAEELDALNTSRKDVEREVQEAAVRHIERASNQADAPCLVVAEDGWHPGVIGIVAGRLKDKYRRPTFVIAVDISAGMLAEATRSATALRTASRFATARRGPSRSARRAASSRRWRDRRWPCSAWRNARWNCCASNRPAPRR